MKSGHPDPIKDRTVLRRSGSASRRIFITGWGLVTPMGDGAWPTFRALLAGQTLQNRMDRLSDQIDPVSLVQAVGVAKGPKLETVDPSIDLAERAAREALHMAGVSADRCAILVATSKGAVSALSAVMSDPSRDGGVRTGARPYVNLQDRMDRALVVALGPCGYMTHHLAQRLGVTPMQHIVAACSSSLAAVDRARRMLCRESAGGVDRVLVVTSEAALLPVFVHSYQRLGVLPTLTRSGYRALPLDRRRCGFVPTQMSAAVVLEAFDEERSDAGPTPSIELVDSAVASEAYDLIRSAPSMPGLRSVAARLLGDRRVDLVHPHATGTFNHDPSELSVIVDSVSRTGPVDLYASKGAIGHGLGASGLASLVIACMCGRSQRRPPMPWLEQPLDTGSSCVSLRADAASEAIGTQAVFAGGFGGHVAGAVITGQ